MTAGKHSDTQIERRFKRHCCCKTVIGSAQRLRHVKRRGSKPCTSTDFVVARNDLQQCKVIETQLPDAAALPDDALLVKVTRFAFTANNITYAVLGDQSEILATVSGARRFRQHSGMGIWRGDRLEASRRSPQAKPCSAISRWRRISSSRPPTSASAALRDAAAHRQGVAPVYNAYARVSGDPAFAGKQGDYQALLRPLFMLSFLVDDFLAENEFYGAKRVMLSSASSKTAFGLAHLLHARGNGIKVIGLTSAGNTAFVKSLGCYDEVVTYDTRHLAAGGLRRSPSSTWPAAARCATTLHRHFGDQMKYSGRIGLTHRKSSPDEPAQYCPAPSRHWFFAPDQIRKRAKEWGPGGVDERFGAAWSGFVAEPRSMDEGDARAVGPRRFNAAISTPSTAACRRIRG